MKGLQSTEGTGSNALRPVHCIDAAGDILYTTLGAVVRYMGSMRWSIRAHLPSLVSSALASLAVEDWKRRLGAVKLLSSVISCIQEQVPSTKAEFKRLAPEIMSFLYTMENDPVHCSLCGPWFAAVHALVLRQRLIMIFQVKELRDEIAATIDQLKQCANVSHVPRPLHASTTEESLGGGASSMSMSAPEKTAYLRDRAKKRSDHHNKFQQFLAERRRVKSPGDVADELIVSTPSSRSSLSLSAEGVDTEDESPEAEPARRRSSDRGRSTPDAWHTTSSALLRDTPMPLYESTDSDDISTFRACDWVSPKQVQSAWTERSRDLMAELDSLDARIQSLCAVRIFAGFRVHSTC